MADKTKHHLIGKTVIIEKGIYAGNDYTIEGYWDELTGKSWGISDGNPACLKYAWRISTVDTDVSTDDRVFYGKIGYLGELIHECEVEEIQEDNPNPSK